MNDELRLDIKQRMTKDYWTILTLAKNVGDEFTVKFVGTEFIVLAMLRSGFECGVLLKRFGVTEKAYRDAIKNDFSESNAMFFTSTTKSVINKSAEIADAYGMRFLAPEHLLYAILCFRCTGNVLLKRVCPYYDGLGKAVINVLETWKARSTEEGKKKSEYTVPVSPMGGTKATDRPAPETEYPSIKGTVLEKFGYDMTEAARRGKIDPVIGRTKETERIINTLSRRHKNNPLIIGEPGIGKTAVVEGLARKIASGDVPENLKNVILFSLDLSSMVAGAKMRGEFEQRFKEMIEFVKENENVILFIDEIHVLVSGVKSDGVDASEILKPSLARGDIRVIGATTIAEYRKYIEKDTALERRFFPIMVEPPSVRDSIEILKGLKDTFEAHHHVEITDEAIVAAVRLSDRYINDRFLPDKAIDLIDEAAAHARIVADAPDKELIEKQMERANLLQEIDYARASGRDYASLYAKLNALNEEIERLKDEIEKQSVKNHPYIDGEDVAKVISELTGIPVTRLNEEERQKLSGLEDCLKQRVVGQDEAVSAVSHAVRRAMTGVKDPKKPIGTFLFVGPTGVGKTELTKALAEALFGNENLLIRIDMGEYMESNSTAKLIGAPPGYVGYEDEGQLTEKVRRKPYSVVLFDEIEKAHKDVYNLFLQIFDDGRLTDSKGRLVDFKNTVIIMTTNVGNSDDRTFVDAESPLIRKQRTMEALKKRFKPEFLNRIDEIVLFNPLSKADCEDICDIMLDGLANRLSQIDITFSCGKDVADVILEKGYSEEYGARNLKRTVSEVLENAISEKIIEGTIRHGDSVTAFVNEYGSIDFSVSR